MGLKRIYCEQQIVTKNFAKKCTLVDKIGNKKLGNKPIVI